MTPSDTDSLLSSIMGSSLQAATARLIVGALALAAIVGLVVYLIR